MFGGQLWLVHGRKKKGEVLKEDERSWVMKERLKEKRLRDMEDEWWEVLR